MFEKIRKMKNQKGFTLVELIVVLVILAILAAMLVPALTGYIDKANKEKVVATTRQVVMAAQAEVSETYGSKELKASTIVIEADKEANDQVDGEAAGTKSAVTGAAIVKLAEVGELPAGANAKYTLKNGIKKITVKYDGDGKVTEVTVTQGTKICKYTASTGEYTYPTTH